MTRSVLLIEDDLFSATVLADGLEALGWTVLREASGTEGLARALRDRPDAVITDVALPGVDGATIAATLRLAPGRRVPVVLVSARDGVSGLAEEVGADRFFEKPLRPKVADVALRELLAPKTTEPEGPGPLRLPAAEGLAPGAPLAAAETGALAAGWLPPLLLRLFDRRATGVLEVESGGERSKVFFSRGAPAAARTSAPGTELGRVLARLGVLTAEAIELAVAEARRNRRPLGDELVADTQVERTTAERALREQIVARLLALGAGEEGTWTFVAGEALGLAGFEVPAGVAYWRLGADVAEPIPTRTAYVRLDTPPAVWPLLDPGADLAAAHALFVAGTAIHECVRVGGPETSRCLRVLHRFGLVRFVDEPPSASHREAGLALLDTGEVEAALAARHRCWVDADHYTLFGLAPDASAAEIHAASLEALASVSPEHLPTGVSGVTRDRAQALFTRALEASRVLLDPERRALYDTMLARKKGWRTEALGNEDHAVLLAERARQAFRRGEYVTASALFRAALALEGNDADILAMLGRTRRLACPEDPTAGEEELRRAVAMDPDAEFPLYWLARAHYERGELPESRALLRRILAHNPEFELAREAMRLFS